MSEVHTDLFRTYTEREERYLLNPGFLLYQTQENKESRYKVVDWLIEVVNDYYKTTSPLEILALATMLMDTFLEKQELRRVKYQLLGIMTLQIASKFELKSPMKLDDCVYLCGNAYTKKECLVMEQTILSVLDYNLSLPTSHTFLSILLDIDNSTDTVAKLSSYLLLKILPEYQMLKYKPSIVASAIIYFSKKFLKKAPYWSQELNHLTNYRVRDFKRCLNDMTQIQNIDFDLLNTKLGLDEKNERCRFHF